MSIEKGLSREGLPKLVRDRIPSKITKDGFTPITHFATETEYVKALRAKLREEVNELINAPTQKAFIEELADIEEVLDAFMDQAGVDPRQIKEKKTN